MKQSLLTIGEASKALGVNSYTIRKWESSGRIAPATRNSRGERVFSPADIEHLRKFVRGPGRPRRRLI